MILRVVGALLLALATAGTFHAWLGWGDVPRDHPDPLTGSMSGASGGWQLAGFFLTLAVLVVVAVWRLPAWVPVAVVPPATPATIWASMSGEFPLWMVGAAFLTLWVTLGTGMLSLVTYAVRSSRRPSGVDTTVAP